eukprot:m.49966 g.49966  ORF g.49966 m.49966 type:complete len:447 (+) comp21179_c0_seq1:285-1625(+)
MSLTTANSLGAEVPSHVLRKSKLGDAIVVDGTNRVRIDIKKPVGTSFVERTSTERIIVMLGGICFAFNAGYLNGCTMDAFGNANKTRAGVSGVTGTYTSAALLLADGDGSEGGQHIVNIVCFTLGSTIVGLMMPRRKAWELGPEYGPAFLLGSIILAVSAYFAHYYRNDDSDIHREVFYFASAACGLQNGMTSMYTGGLIRSTHHTGTTTDIGLILGQCIRGNLKQLWKLKVLVLLALFFFMGSFTSFFATQQWQELAITFNAMFFFLIGIAHMVFVSFKEHISICNAASGHWSWHNALKYLVPALIEGHTDVKDMSRAELEQLFDYIDQNGDGAFCADELVAALLKAGVEIKRKNIKAMLKAGDTDGDGTISKAEFVMLLGAHLEGKDEMDVALEIREIHLRRSPSNMSLNKDGIIFSLPSSHPSPPPSPKPFPQANEITLVTQV